LIFILACPPKYFGKFGDHPWQIGYCPSSKNFFFPDLLCLQKNAPFYAHWVSKFFAFSNRNQELGSNLRVQKFLNQLKSQKKIANWQIKQVEEKGRKAFSGHHPDN
jgi:hypothetical protein